jgi:hypothetical protein
MVPRSRQARIPAMQRPHVDTLADPYVALVLSVLHRAVRDASGQCDSPGKTATEKLQAEAQAWLQDEQAVARLLELAGYDASPVLRRLGL